MRPDFDHALGHNKREWSPRRCIFFDTETGYEENATGAELPLRSWQLCMVWRDKPEGHRLRERWYQGTTGLELARTVDELVTTEHATWMWAHNLGFDLSTSRLPVHMPRMLWEWTRGTITADAPWMSWRKGNRSITAVDSFSHLPAALAKIGENIGLPKLAMPAFDAPADEWATYCRRDVEILRDGVLQFLDWWDAEKLGNLSVTGPATGWNCWRHNTDNLRVRIDADPETRAFGRASIYGGRRSSWRVGDLGRGPWVEVDVTTAHLSIVRHELMPVSVLSWHESVPLDHPVLDSDRVGVLADCTVRTETPRYPKLTDFGVLYPVGEFTTRLCSPELREARRRGELVEVRKALCMGLGRPMRQWGDWVAATLAKPPETTPPTALLAMKGWSRSAVGKWAGRTSREVARVKWPDDGWRVESGYFNDPSVPATTVYGAGEARTYVRDLEGHDSFPAAYAYVTSHMRVVLGRLIELVGDEHLVTCNTDSVVVHIDALRPWAASWAKDDDEVIESAVLELQQRMAPYALSVKHVAETLRIRTPEHLVFGEGETQQRKVASVSKHAREVDTWVFEGDTWPGLAKQLSIGQSEAFNLVRRRVDVGKAKPLSWLRPDGTCEPPRYAVSADLGDVMMLPEVLVDAGGNRKALAQQHKSLVALLGA